MVGPQGPAGLGARPAGQPRLQQFRALSRQPGVPHKLAGGKVLLLRGGEGAVLRRSPTTALPKQNAITVFPAAQPIQGVGGGCLSMFPATSRRSVEHALRQEEQLLPAAKVIVAHHRGQSFCQNFAPQRSGCCGNMPEGWRAPGLDFSNGRQGL